MTRSPYFLLLFPCAFLQYVILPIMNQDAEDAMPIEWWEMVRWMGMWFLLATTNGHVRDEFWERSQKDRRFDGAPFLLDDLMSKTRFNYILGRLKLFSLPYPSFKDLFHPV